ncbi:hypothetical protein [Hymenobacter lapidiphilus]|uniref:STAS/SEC14 domain-containing protein n=1 Tax=Hymenobacter lapidiphilus TaxID=2608003 RepID=A0A7Y7PSQ2_9BACT|nr:hypothetical protein [Hymenobacter lapidiphilus]NVO33340.1 hypothetical protein [Hymenobacter lapidiphilus]
METLLETPRLVISYDEANDWLHLLWRGSHNPSDEKTCIMEVLEKIRLTQATRVLNDSTLDEDGWSELTYWIANDFMPQVADAGVVAAAWVMPDNLQARIDVHNVLVHVSRPLIDTFLDAEAAYKWLKTEPTAPDRVSEEPKE